MSLSVEVGEGLKRTVAFAMPSTEVDQKVNAMIQEEAKKMNISGFPPGKVPVRVAKGYIGKAAREQVREEAMFHHFFDAIEKDKAIKPAGQPVFDIVNDKTGGEIEFKATFEIFPTIEREDAKGLKVEKLTAEVKDEDVDKMIDTLRDQFAETKSSEGPAKSGDELTISFKGEIDGEAFDGGSADDVPLELGSGQMIPGFESGLEGSKTGETVKVEPTFPKDYHVKALAGKKAVFTVEVKAIAEKIRPEVDQAFAERFKADSVEALKKDVRGNMQRELSFALAEKLKTAVLDALIEELAFDVPEVAVEQEARHMQGQMLRQMGIKEVDLSKLPPMPIEPYKEEATKRVRYGVLISHFMEALKVEATDEAIDAMIEKLSTVYESPEEVKSFYNENAEKRQEVSFMVKEDLVTQKLSESAKVTEKQVNFFDIIQPKDMRKVV